MCVSVRGEGREACENRLLQGSKDEIQFLPLSLFRRRRERTVGICPMSICGISETGEPEHWERCRVLPQKPGQVDGQYGLAGAGGGRVAGQSGAGADVEAGSPRAPGRERFPSNQHRDSASEVMGQSPGLSPHICLGGLAE